MKTRRYEAMFLFDSAAAHDWATIEQEVRRLLDRIGATIEVCLKFDEQRKLAYEIKRRKRGTYVLVYFQADPLRIHDLDRDAKLSELLLRHLIVNGEHVKDEKVAELKAWPVEKPLAPATSERSRDDIRMRGEGDGSGFEPTAEAGAALGVGGRD